jgi:hypothetical protein
MWGGADPAQVHQPQEVDTVLVQLVQLLLLLVLVQQPLVLHPASASELSS